MQVRFTARGDFRPLQTSLRNLGVSMNQSVQGFGHSVRTNVSTPMDDMMKKMQRGRLTFRDLGTVMRDQTRFLQHHNQAMAQSGEVVARASGRMSVMRDNTRNLDASMVTLGQRLTLVNTAMHAVSRNTIAMGKNMQWAGRQVMVGITIPLALLARTALQVGEDYDRNMTRIIKVNNDASDASMQSNEMFNLVSDSIRRQTAAIVEMGAELGMLADESTEMVAQFSQMGFAGAELDQLSEAAMRLSRVSGTDLQTSIELTRITAQAFGIELQDLTETFARLNLVENNTSLALDEMATALPVVAGVANTMGVEIETVSGLLAMMKENGISAKEGATALRTGLIQIVQEATDPAIEAFEKINLDLIQMKENMQVEGEGDVMHFFVELGEHLQNIAESGEGSQAMLNDFTGAIGKLTGTRQAARFLTFLSEIPDMFEEGSVAQRAFIGATTDAEEALRIYDFEQRQVQESAAGMAETLRAELNVQMRLLGESMLDAANAVRRIGVEILRWFNELDETVRRNVLIAAAAAASLGVITMTMGILVNAIGQLGVAFTMLFRRTDYLAKQEEALRQAVSGASTQIDRSAVSMGAAARSADATTASLHRMAEGYLRAGQAASGMVTAQATSQAGSAVTGAAESDVFIGTPGGRERRDEREAPRRRPAGRARTALRGAGIATIGKAAVDNMRQFAAYMTGAASSSGKLSTAFASISKYVGGFAASIAAVKGTILAIGAAILAIPILANPGAALAGFRESLEGPLSRLREALDGLMSTVRRIAEVFRQQGEEGSGLSRMSEIIGRIVGFLAGGVVDALAFIARILNGLANVFEFVFYLVSGIAAAITGAGNATELFTEAVKALWRAFYEVIAAVADVIAGLLRGLEQIPGVTNLGADALEEWAESLRNSERIASSITDEVVEQNKQARELKGLYEDHEEALEESEQLKRDMLEAEIDINNFTKQDILDNEKLTDELKAQVLALLRRREIELQLSSIQEQRSEAEERLSQASNDNIYEQRILQQGLNELKELELDLLNESVDSIDNYIQKLRDRREQEELIDAFLDDQVENKEALKARQEEINEKLREAERRANQWVSALQSASRDVMSNIVRAVEDALEAQIRAEEEAIDRREEMRMSANQDEIDRINDNADAELQRIEEQERREEEANRRREQFFQEERRRINLLRGMQEDQAMLDISIARGDIAEAARIRIGMQARSEEFIIESYERQQEAFQDARQEEIRTEREKIKEIRDEQIEALEDAQDLIEKQFEIERDAAREAAEERRRSVRQYLDDWGNVIPATESEFRAHMSALERSMEGFGISMGEISKKYTKESGDNIRNGFETAVDAAADSVAESEKWRAAGESVAESFTEGLREELKDLERQIEGDIAQANIGSEGRPNVIAPDGSRVTVPGEFHSGGRVTGPSSPGLKPDETPAVLQKGEYVIQRSAVRQVGEDYLNLINNGMRFHDGGPVRASGVNLTDSGALGPAAGSMIGQFANNMLDRFTSSGGGGEDITGKMTANNFGRSVGRAIGEAAMMFMPGALGDAAGWRGDSATGWPPRQWGVLSANTRAAKQYWRGLSDFPGGIGTGVHRGVAASDHSWGKALDFMVAPLGNMPTDSQRRLGWQVAGWHVNNPDVFGTKYVIWDKMINSGDARGWRPYTRYGTNPGPTLGHYDHVHVSYLHEGGLVPSMRTGGKIKLDNTIANLHRGERVLTEPSTRALETAIQEFAASGGGRNSYNLEFNIDGGSIDEAELAKKVVFEIDRMERTKGRKRVVRT